MEHGAEEARPGEHAVRPVLESAYVPKQTKEELRQAYAALNPVKLGREISRLQDRLDAAARSKTPVRQDVNLEYIPT